MATQQQETELKDQFKIKFDGDKNQIDANTLVNYLIHLNTIIQEIHKETEPDRKISIKINALSTGSFLVEIELQSILQSFLQLFTKDNVEYLAAIFGVYQGLILLREKLGGKKPQSVVLEGDDVKIQIGDGSSLKVNINIYKIYTNNAIVDKALTKQFETLEADENIDGVKILDKKNRPLVDINRASFGSLTQPNEALETEEKINDEIKKHAILSIIKLSFDPKLKSDFYYHGIKITAYIKDKEFYEKVDNGQQFAKGDALEVNLKVERVYDETVATEVIKGYEILEVIRHIPRDDKSQLKLDMRGS